MRAASLLSRAFVRAHPTDAAPVLERLPVEEVSALLESLPPPTAAGALQGMEATAAARCLAGVDSRRAASILEALRPEVAATVLLRLEPPVREGLLAEMPAKSVDGIRKRLQFRIGTAGAVVDSKVLSIQDQVTVEQALDRLRQPSQRDHHFVYVVDREDRLLGALPSHRLLLAAPKASLASIMDPPAARLPASASHAALLADKGWQAVHELPVVDSDGRLLGVVGHDVLMRLRDDGSVATGLSPATSFGMAFADLCWVGMTRIVTGVATAALGSGAAGETTEGGRDAG
jgi:magnesium transporter